MNTAQAKRLLESPRLKSAFNCAFFHPNLTDEFLYKCLEKALVKCESNNNRHLPAFVEFMWTQEVVANIPQAISGETTCGKHQELYSTVDTRYRDGIFYCA